MASLLVNLEYGKFAGLAVTTFARQLPDSSKFKLGREDSQCRSQPLTRSFTGTP